MKSLCNILYLLIYLKNVQSTWINSNNSNIYLLGLFPDSENLSENSTLSIHSRAMFKSAILLSQKYNITIKDQFIEWKSYQTGGDIINALSKTCQEISSSTILGIVGPAYSREALQIASFSKTIGIPVISYSATDPDLSDRISYSTFYRTVPSDNKAALAIVKLFLRFNWTTSIIIYQNDPYGSSGEKILSKQFHNYNLIIKNTIIFDISTNSIRGDLRNLLENSASRIVILWANPIYTRLILENALDCDVLGPQFTWILSSSISLNSFDKIFYPKLIGILTVEPVTGYIINEPINKTLLNSAYQIWKDNEPETYPGYTKVNPYALFSFDATWILIQSLKIFSLKNQNLSLIFSESSFCFNRRFLSSNLLINTIDSIQFLGVSGFVEFTKNLTDRINGSFYYSQNIQSATLNEIDFSPVLSYTDSTDWQSYRKTNIIIWPGNTLIPSNDYPKPEGIILRIGVVQSIPFTIVTYITDISGENQTKLIGYIPDLIELLQLNMKFIPDIRLAPLNQTYLGLVQDVANGIYDIVIGDVTVTATRREIADFSSSIFDNSLRLIVRKGSSDSIDLLSYLRPFSINLWLTLLGGCIIASILLCLIEREENRALQNQTILSQLSMSIWYSFGNLVGYGVDFHVRTAAGRLITVGLYMLSLILVASYTANLASNLTISKSKEILSGIDDIKNGKILSNRIGIRLGTASETYYLNEISDGKRNFYSLTTRQNLFDSLLLGLIDVSFVDEGYGEYATNNLYCNLTLIGDGFDTGIFAIVTPKKWLYAQQLDFQILSLRESGSLDSLKTKWFQSQSCSDTILTTTAIGIQSMGGLFLTFTILLIFAILLVFWKKRRIFKNYLFNFGFRQKTSFRKKIFTTNQQTQILNNTQNSALPPSTIIFV